MGCSGSTESEPAPIEDIVPSDPKDGGARPDGGSPADVSDPDGADDGDVLIPNDGDRSDVGSQCIEAEDCLGMIEVGICELAVCDEGRCVVTSKPDGTACDDGNTCTVDDACKGGRCHGTTDNNAPGCIQAPKPGALWFTEIMGNPKAVPGSVDAVEGQWFEIRGPQPVRLDGLRLVYYEWDDGTEAPSHPTGAISHVLASSHSEAGYSWFVRSPDPKKNGWGPSHWTYGAIQFSKTKNARLALMMPAWDGSFPLDESLIVADIVLPAGVFSDDNMGRSWQLSDSSIDDPTGPWCHAALDGMTYADESNYGSPRQPNSDCP